MSSKRLDDIGYFRRHGYTLCIYCLACKRVAVLDPTVIVELRHGNGWSRQMTSVERRLRCSVCKSKDVHCGPGLWRA